MTPSAAALPLLLALHLPLALAQNACNSDAAPPPQALYERFLSADCAACWRQPAFTPAASAALLDWIVPSGAGDEAALSAAARTESLSRLAALGRAAPGTTDVHIAPMGERLPGRLRLAFGPAVNDYVGATVSYLGALPGGSGGEWTVSLALVEQIPVGADGTLAPRNLVRNLLQRKWEKGNQLSKKELFKLPPQTRWSERPVMQIGSGTDPARLALIGWMEDGQGRIVATARAQCPASP